MLYSGGDYKVLRLFILKDQPHTLYIVLRISPVTERIQIAQVQLILLTLCDSCSRQCYLSRNEGLASPLTLMIKQNTGTTEHIISFSVFLYNPITILLGNCIRTVRMKRSRLSLRNFFYLSIKF